MERFKMDQPVLLDRKRREKGRKEGGGGVSVLARVEEMVHSLTASEFQHVSSLSSIRNCLP